MYPEQDDEDVNHKYTDLFNFLNFLKEHAKRKNASTEIYHVSTNSNFNEINHSYENTLPVALLQLLIILLVLLIVLFMCKCNKIMRFCRDGKPKTAEELEDERYHDKMRLKDYLCFFWYNYKMRRRFKRRRLRRFNNKKSGHSKFNLKSGKASSKQRYSSNNRASSIFRRRSIRYRYRNNMNGVSGESTSALSSSKRRQMRERHLSMVASSSFVDATSTKPMVSVQISSEKHVDFMPTENIA